MTPYNLVSGISILKASPKVANCVLLNAKSRIKYLQFFTCDTYN